MWNFRLLFERRTKLKRSLEETSLDIAPLRFSIINNSILKVHHKKIVIVFWLNIVGLLVIVATYRISPINVYYREI